MKKKKGFTLVELLAVIVILAVILIIAVPRISEVINSSKKASFESSAKTIAAQAEKKYMENEVLGNTGSFECSDVVKLNDSDYASCTITFDESGNASVSITGSGKFAGLTIRNATKNSATATELTETAAKYFSYKVEKNVEVIDQSKCVAYFKNLSGSDDGATTVCTGGKFMGYTLIFLVNYVGMPESDYETAGLKVTNGSNIAITGYSVAGGLDVVIPSMIDGKTVVAIADYAFTTKGVIPTEISSNYTDYKVSLLSYNSNNNYVIKPLAISIEGLGITSVVIPNTITSIGESAFYGNDLTSVTIPSSVISIGVEVFKYNFNIVITNNSSIENIQDVWNNIVGTSVFINGNVIKIGRNK